MTRPVSDVDLGADTWSRLTAPGLDLPALAARRQPTPPGNVWTLSGLPDVRSSTYGRRGVRSAASGIQAQMTVGGRYRLLRRLGADELAETWEAFDSRLDRAVALRLRTGDAPATLPAGEGAPRLLDGGEDPTYGQFLVYELDPSLEATQRLNALPEGAAPDLERSPSPHAAPAVEAAPPPPARNVADGPPPARNVAAATPSPGWNVAWSPPARANADATPSPGWNVAASPPAPDDADVRPSPGWSVAASPARDDADATPSPGWSVAGSPPRSGRAVAAAAPARRGRGVGLAALVGVVLVALTALAVLARGLAPTAEPTAATKPTAAPTTQPQAAAPPPKPTAAPAAKPTAAAAKPAAAPQAPGAAAVTASPVDTIHQHYALIDARRYADGYTLMDARLRSLNSPADYAGWFANKVSIKPLSVDLVSQMPSQAVVRSVVDTTDTVNGRAVSSQVAEQFVLKLEDGAWRIDSVNRVTPPASRATNQGNNNQRNNNQGSD
jgi:hypothetical protein